MASLVLQAAGSFIGQTLGGPMGATVGRALGGMAGSLIDSRLFSAKKKNVPGPTLTDLRGITASEGTFIPRVYGRCRIGGHIIWATHFEQTLVHSKTSQGSGKGSKTTTSEYIYFANVAIGICEGPISEIRRIWADGTEIDQTLYTLRFYYGDEEQLPDPLILAKETPETTPAYRGLAYVVFEHLPLADFGQRVPQFNFEVIRPVSGLNRLIRGVDLIPGASEFAYSVHSLTQTLMPGVTQSENRHQLYASSDWIASLDSLQALCPNLESVALVVTWFGDDLRCNLCKIMPRVDSASKQIQNKEWSVAGLTRSSCPPVSYYNGAPAYGGTPDDQSVIDAIYDLKRRSLRVILYPFIMMDIPENNNLPDPWTGYSSQPSYPWRGRITCTPAPSEVNSVNGKEQVSAQVISFFGTHTPPLSEWSFRRFILHYASLCAQAGGVNAFLIGSELTSLTRLYSKPGTYPAAHQLEILAQDVKSILGTQTKISYAADWTEYGAYFVSETKDIYFPLDIVWSSPSIDFIGLDIYWPLSDWRNGDSHKDAALAPCIYDRSYLESRMDSGEAFDWFYENEDARIQQNRTPIVDIAYGKDWIFRPKDLKGWWSNLHIERSAGIENTTSTSWVPCSKPLWIIETGCPAVDRGSNAPNVFPDPKSSEKSVPYFSRGYSDTLIQMRMMEAFITHFTPECQGYREGSNPYSSLYNGTMVDPSNIHIWAWDARPFPAFPSLTSVWQDADNWEKGHWLNGRLESTSISDLVTSILKDFNISIEQGSFEAVDGCIDGYVINTLVSLRGLLEPLSALSGCDILISSGQFKLIPRASSSCLSLDDRDLVVTKQGTLIQATRAEESSLPYEIGLTFYDGQFDYRIARVASTYTQSFSRRTLNQDLSVVMSRSVAQRFCDIWLQDLWIARETLKISVRRSLLALEVGDSLTLPSYMGSRKFRIERIVDGLSRTIEARRVEPSLYDHALLPFQMPFLQPPPCRGQPHVEILDLGLSLRSQEDLQYVAAFCEPWTGPLALWRNSGSESFEFFGLISEPCTLGTTLTPLLPGPAGRFDLVNRLRISVSRGSFESIEDQRLFAGENRIAVKGDDGNWEILCFGQAVLVGYNEWELSRFLRGLGSQDYLSQREVPEGAPFVVLDASLVPLATGLSDLGLERRWKIGPADRDYSDPSYLTFTTTATSKALKPYAPVQATAKRSAQGVLIQFIRRSRKESDSWDCVEIPLGEEGEAYEIDILAQGQVKRTLNTSIPSVLYASDLEQEDFGARQSFLDVQIFQVSPHVGRGWDLTLSLPIL